MGVYVCPLAAPERTNQFAPNLACLCSETWKRFYWSQNLENVLSSRPGKDVFCCSESKNDKKMRQEQICSFWRWHYKRKDHNLESCRGSSPGKDVSCTLKTNRSRTQIRSTLFRWCYRKGIITTRKVFSDRVLIKLFFCILKTNGGGSFKTNELYMTKQ